MRCLTENHHVPDGRRTRPAESWLFGVNYKGPEDAARWSLSGTIITGPVDWADEYFADVREALEAS